MTIPNEREAQSLWKRVTLARGAQLLFAGVALVSVAHFASVVSDGEQRRAPDTLVQVLGPNYTGNNRIAPDFDLVDRDGRRHRLHELRGKTVVLHFFTRTCQPCVEEIQHSLPVFDEIVRERKDVVLVIVAVDPNWQAIAPLVPNGLRSLILFDPGRRVVSGKYGTRLFPETWVIDPEGIIRARFDHPLDWSSPVLINYLLALR